MPARSFSSEFCVGGGCVGEAFVRFGDGRERFWTNGRQRQTLICHLEKEDIGACHLCKSPCFAMMSFSMSHLTIVSHLQSCPICNRVPFVIVSYLQSYPVFATVSRFATVSHFAFTLFSRTSYFPMTCLRRIFRFEMCILQFGIS